MAEPTKRFFEALAKKKSEPLLRTVNGTIRCDLEDGERTEHWYVTIKKGDVTVSHKRAAADCVLSTDLATFEAILGGEMNAMAAVLRGLVSIEGRMRMVVALQSLFTPSAGAPTEQVAGYAGRPT
ncbi:MAG TPA: SCP2 sterol-binding domain-containing protein [Thermoleophilia bacterium]|nr:SCP2 sterol-binding domain-containing protein [Thermoleophilia bacterium]